MKTIVLTLVAVFMMFSGQSQIGHTQYAVLKTSDVEAFKTKTSSRALNANYLDKVLDHSMAVHVSALENRVAFFDVTKSRGFKKSKAHPFKVKFKTEKGYVEVFYDKDGTVIESKGRYKEVKLPRAVRISLFKTYEGFILLDSDYLVNYKNGSVEKLYYVKIGKGSDIKKIKMHADGTFIQ
ncbi:hypothetical protein KFZ70_14820 [Tamlana fucoidanivorans]|uniref:Nicotinate-nucleotide adenylyltransferase n=1 Tax=Allotamlana fucoidanivorans TaxID=2583814 RepID=A0A5C4SFR6_9FLAO|nr:hypothetical protein [Tamlana fucoidanivorans]TNJ42444.1 hypothetical protein FGF67_14350 [Tamlana fucoidanivorans]